MSDPQLLTVPKRFNTVNDVLECAKKLDLGNVIVLSENEDGSVVLLTSNEVTVSGANWLIDRAKMVLLAPTIHERR